MNASSDEQRCWFCNLGLDQLCLKPRPERDGQTSARYTCAGHRLLRFHISGNLVRGIAALLNRKC